MMGTHGDSPDNPKTLNLKEPGDAHVTITAEDGRPLVIDPVEFAKAADRLGAGKNTTMSIRGYKNAKGEIVPDYDSVRIVE